VDAVVRGWGRERGGVNSGGVRGLPERTENSGPKGVKVRGFEEKNNWRLGGKRCLFSW